MGISSFLQHAIPLTADIVGQRQQVERQQREQGIKDLMALDTQRRQNMQQSMSEQIGQAQIGHLQAQTLKLQEPTPSKANIMRGPGGQLLDVSDPANPKPVGPGPVAKPTNPIVGSPEWKAAEQYKASLRPDPQQTYAPFQGTDENGKPVVRPFNTKQGTFGPVADVAPKASANGQSGSAQAQQARLMAAVSEARLADERMRAFEDKLLGGQTSVSPLKQAAGSLTTNLADSHSPFGALTQAASEFGLNKSDPEYAQYLRDASTIGRAEQMMSPRGGNETMVRANALLSRAGTGAMKNTIDASRMARQALFGQSGGIAQTLSPQQNDKLQQGVAKIKAGDTGAPQAPAATSPKKPKNDYGIFGGPPGGGE